MMMRGAPLSPRQQSFSTLGSSWSSLGSIETIGSDASGGVFRLDDDADDEAATLRGGSSTWAGEGSARSDEEPDVDHDESGSGEESAEADEVEEEEDKNADEDDEPAPDRAARVLRAVSAGGEGAAVAQRAGAARAAPAPSKGSPPPKAPAWAKDAAGLRKTGLATAVGSEQPASTVGDTGKAGSVKPPGGNGHLFKRSLGSLSTMTEKIVQSTQQEKQGPEDAPGEPQASAKTSTWNGSLSPSTLRTSPRSSQPPGCRLSGSSPSHTEAAAPSVLVVDVPEPVPTSPPKSPLDSPDISPTSAASADVAGAGAAAGAEAATAAAPPAQTLFASPQASPKDASPFSARSGGRSPGSGRATEVPATGSAAPATTEVPTTGSAAPARSAAEEQDSAAAIAPAGAPAGAGAAAGEGPALKPGAGCCVVM
jgi:hypothetical protein